MYKQFMESRARATSLTPTVNATPTTLTTTGGGGGGGGGGRAARLPSGGGSGQIIPANQTTATGGRSKARVPRGRPVVEGKVVSKSGQASKGLLRGLGKAAVPVQAAMNAKDIYDLVSGNVTGDDSAQEEANRDYQAMGDDGVLMRMGKSAINPINTIAGMFGTLSQAVDDTGMDIDAEANRMALLPQNLKARDTGNARDEAMAEYFTPEERAMVEKIAVRDKGLMRAVGDAQTPEQAKELRDYFFGVPEPTAEDAVDQGLAPAFEPVTRGDLDPDMQDMMGTTGVNPDDYDLAGGAEEPEVDYTDQAVDLFKNTHGTEFDPKSSEDRGKLEKMKKMLAEDGGMKGRTPNQVALEFYRRFPQK